MAKLEDAQPLAAELGYVRVVRSLWFVTKCRFESCLAFKDDNNEKDNHSEQRKKRQIGAKSQSDTKGYNLL